MPVFKYTAMDKSGRTIGREMEADSESALSKALGRDGLFLIEAVLLKAPKSAAPAASPGLAAAKSAAPVAALKPKEGKGKVPVQEVALFTNQLALMLRASLPVLPAIISLTPQQKNPYFVYILTDIQERIKRGERISAAFSHHPLVFGPVYTNLLAAGEASGTMTTMLVRIADYLDFQSELGRKIRSALVYPLLVLFASVTVVLFLMLFVLPNLTDIFKQFNAPLPLPTQILLGLSTWMRAYWYVYFSAGAGAAYYAMKWFEKPENQAVIDYQILRVPILGAMIESIVVTRMLRILEVLLQSGVPIIKALELTKAAAGQRYYADLIDRVIKYVSEGKGIAAGLVGQAHFPSSVTDMIATAERSGSLPEVFRVTAAHFQKDLDARISDAFAAMEPLFIGGLSIVVAFIVVCILAPIMSLGTIVD